MFLLRVFSYMWIVIVAGIWLAWTIAAIKDGICYLRRDKKEKIEDGLCFVHWAVVHGLALFVVSLIVFVSLHY